LKKKYSNKLRIASRFKTKFPVNLTYLSNVFLAKPDRNAVPMVNATSWALHGKLSNALPLHLDVYKTRSDIFCLTGKQVVEE
jgi:ribulose-5-phosphate 4-epimerase/fuculose-1-phosphate aldolase